MRRETDPFVGKLSSVLKDILAVRITLREAGATDAAIATTTGRMLREKWPVKGREWHYHCETCSDSGWQPRVCTPQTPCGRPFRVPGAHSDDWTGKGQCSPGHAYVQPCLDCARGYQRRSDLARVAQPDDYAAAGKTAPKPKGFSRWGDR